MGAIGLIFEVISNRYRQSVPHGYHRAQSFVVHIPTARTEENAHVYEDATRMAQPARIVNLIQPKNVTPQGKTDKPGRNDPCPCGSGAKFKRCHGR